MELPKVAQPTPGSAPRTRASDIELGRAYDAAHNRSLHEYPRNARRAHEAGLRAVVDYVCPAPTENIQTVVRALLGPRRVHLAATLLDAGLRFAYPGEHLEYGFQMNNGLGGVADFGSSLERAESWRESVPDGDLVERVCSTWQLKPLAPL
jgi:hypothetical protein